MQRWSNTRRKHTANKYGALEQRATVRAREREKRQRERERERDKQRQRTERERIAVKKVKGN